MSGTCYCNFLHIGVARTATNTARQSSMHNANAIATDNEVHHDKQKSQFAICETRLLPWTCNHSTTPHFLKSRIINAAVNATMPLSINTSNIIIRTRLLL